MKLILFIVITKIAVIHCANILAVITTPSYSHQAPFQPLWREVANRGHQVTVITTDPQKNASIKNLKEIDISHTYKIYEEYKVFHVHCGSNMSFLNIGKLLAKVFHKTQEYQLSLPEIQNLIRNKDVKFDLVITEAQSPIMMSFAWRFKCPLIAVSSMDAPMTFHDSVGNIVHPVANPDMNLDIVDLENINYLDRLKSFFYNAFYRYHIYKNSFPRHHEQAKTFFGEDLPTFAEIQNNISALFISTHPVTHTVRPSNLNTINIGSGTIMKKPKPLPRDLQNFMDGAKEGIIYFCLGSNIIGDMLEDNFLDTVIKAFGELPYKVLLKLDFQPENVPANVKIQKWMPQQDILRHPNVKLFITHGGLQSLQEGIYNGVPIIGIPICGDAFSNINKMVSMGYGKRLNVKSLTKDLLEKTILEVIEHPKYRQRAQQLMAVYRDEEIPSLQRAVYWTEYIIRHRGAHHLRSPLIDMPFWKYYMLDIVGFLAFLLILYVSVLWLAIIKIKDYVCSKWTSASKKTEKGKKKSKLHKE